MDGRNESKRTTQVRVLNGLRIQVETYENTQKKIASSTPDEAAQFFPGITGYVAGQYEKQLNALGEGLRTLPVSNPGSEVGPEAGKSNSGSGSGSNSGPSLEKDLARMAEEDKAREDRAAAKQRREKAVAALEAFFAEKSKALRASSGQVAPASGGAVLAMNGSKQS